MKLEPYTHIVLDDSVDQEDADKFLNDYFLGDPKPRQDRLLDGRDTRHIIFRGDDSIVAVEEKGGLSEESIEPRPFNDYICIRKNGNGFEDEILEAQDIQELYTHSNFSL